MLNALNPELRDPLDNQARLRMRLGQGVGMLARDRYPGGEIGRIPGAIEPSLKRTQDLIQGGATTLYEPAFEHKGVFILADILERGQNAWRLIEVKSSSRVKDQHLWDLAVQVFVLEGAGLELEDAVLLHMNGEYVRQGELDLDCLFVESTQFNQVMELQSDVERSVVHSLNFLAQNQVPERDIGPYCKDPEDCDFIGHCWSHLPDPSVFDLYRLKTTKKFELYRAGITQIDDVPRDFEMPASSSFHAEAHKAGTPILRQADLHTFLQGLRYPLYFLDLETFSIPVPPFDGLSPYTHVPFQFSLHAQKDPASPFDHIGYLAQPGRDPRIEFIELLLRTTAGEGDIIVYNVSFERNVLKKLAEQIPDYADELYQRIDRLVDLMEPFRQRLYWKPEMGGSVSLKSVLPALVPDLSYEELEVQDGTQAMDVYLKLEDLGASEAAEIQRKALWEYCKLDTLAMVRILEALWGLVS